MKKLIALLLALVLVLSLVACGAEEGEDVGDITGETFETDVLSVLAPDGWKAFPVTDTFDEFEGDYDPNKVNICKGAESEWDIFSNPTIGITYYGPGSMFWSSKEWYDDARDIEGFTLGGYDWIGYTCSSMDYPYTILETTQGDISIQINIMEQGSNTELKAALADADVQAIIASLIIK